MRGSSILLYTDGVSDLRQDAKHEMLLERLGDLPQEFVSSVWAGCLAVRRDAEGIRFINEWVDLSSDIRLLSPVTVPPFDRRFVWHTPEQASLGVLWRSRIAAGDDRAIRVTNLRGRRQIPPAFPLSWSVLRFEVLSRMPATARSLGRARCVLRTLTSGAAKTEAR
jgi:hypothetical protein